MQKILWYYLNLYIMLLLLQFATTVLEEMLKIMASDWTIWKKVVGEVSSLTLKEL